MLKQIEREKDLAALEALPPLIKSLAEAMREVWWIGRLLYPHKSNHHPAADGL
jgi:hypothetical protein